MAAASFYEVCAPSLDEALALTDKAIHLLRLFFHYQGRAGGALAAFGFPGQPSTANMWYLQGNGEFVTPGWRRQGHVLGAEIPATSANEFVSSKAFTFASDAIGSLEPAGEAARKAAVGIELMSQSLIGLNHSANVMGWVQALEAMITDRSSKAQTFLFARRGAYFGCGRNTESLCGRDREACEALRKDPTKADHRKLLNDLQVGTDEQGRACSEWRQLINWYEARSDYAHGGVIRIPPSGGILDTAELDTTIRARVLNFYLVPILTWLSEHPVHPVTDLDRELSAMAGLEGPRH